MNLNSFCFIIAVLLAIADQNDGRRLSQFHLRERDLKVKKIIGGYSAKKGEFPSFVGLAIFSPGFSLTCSGILISDQLVLTAAHCIDDDDINSIYVKPFEANTKKIVKSGMRADRACFPEKFTFIGRSYRHQWDFGVLHLERPFKLSEDVQPAWLPEKPIWPNQKASLVGIGLTYSMNGVKLRPDTVQALPVSLTECNDVREWHICFRHDNYAGHACKGDSGGPVVAFVDGHERVYGITSFSDTKHCTTSIFANVTHSDVYNGLYVIKLLVEFSLKKSVSDKKVICRNL